MKTHVNSMILILKLNLTLLRNIYINIYINPLPHSCAIILLYQLPHGYAKMFLYREPHDYTFMHYENDHAVYLHDGFKTRPLAFILENQTPVAITYPFINSIVYF